MIGDSTRRRVLYWKELQSDIVLERAADWRLLGLNLGASLNGTDNLMIRIFLFLQSHNNFLTNICRLVKLDYICKFKVSGNYSNLKI